MGLHNVHPLGSHWLCNTLVYWTSVELGSEGTLEWIYILFEMMFVHLFCHFRISHHDITSLVNSIHFGHSQDQGKPGF